MDIWKAVQKAKHHVQLLFDSEGITHLGLEEVELDGDCWRITIGFFRPWNIEESSRDIFSQAPKREYKVVLIDDLNGSIQSVKNHPVTTSQ